MTETKRKSGSGLSDAIKLFVVRQLAAYDTPSVVAESVWAEFGTRLTRQQVERYNPERACGKDLGGKLKAEFYRARRAFETDLEGIPTAMKAVRLKMLDTAARRAQARGNDVGMAGHLEQIAKEMGDCFTNRRELTGKAGGPLRVTRDVDNMSMEEVEAELARLRAGDVR